MSFLAGIGLRLLPVGKAIGSGIVKLLQMHVPLWIVAAVLVVGAIRENRAVDAAEKRGRDAAYAQITKQAKELAKRAEKISQDAKEFNRAANARISRTADDVRVLGPGKANCPGAVAPSSGGNQGPGKANAAVDPVSDPARNTVIGLPFPPTIDFAEQHDRCQIDRQTWEDWYKKLVANWGK
jgi:hypothetical protein